MEDAFPSLQEILDRFRAFRREGGLSLSAFAQAAGLSRSALMGMDASEWSPGGGTIRALEQLVGPTWKSGDPVPDSVKPTRAKGGADAAAATIAAE